MQEKNPRRSNRDRSDTTRAQLIAAARRLFVEKGYADTATPDIASAAGMTRGALYHHFEDKRALFRAVAENEAHAVAREIERAAPEDLGPLDMLVKGGEAYLNAMAHPGRTRLLLLDGPSVLGRAEMDAIDGRTTGRTLSEGLAFAMSAGAIGGTLSVDALTHLLSSAFDRAALAVEGGGEADAYRLVLEALIKGLSAKT